MTFCEMYRESASGCGECPNRFICKNLMDYGFALYDAETGVEAGVRDWGLYLSVNNSMTRGGCSRRIRWKTDGR